MGNEWGFLIDENLEPQIAVFLEKEDVRAEHVRDSLFAGADDEADVLPYACEHDRIIVTNDLKDYRDLPESAHEGVVLVYDGERSAFESCIRPPRHRRRVPEPG